jgi:hypothetical protein
VSVGWVGLAIGEPPAFGVDCGGDGAGGRGGEAPGLERFAAGRGPRRGARAVCRGLGTWARAVCPARGLGRGRGAEDLGADGLPQPGDLGVPAAPKDLVTDPLDASRSASGALNVSGMGFDPVAFRTASSGALPRSGTVAPHPSAVRRVAVTAAPSGEAAAGRAAPSGSPALPLAGQWTRAGLGSDAPDVAPKT